MISSLSSLFFFFMVLAVLIAFHEFGHFYAARKFNVHVIRFSIGFGKPLFRLKDKKGTEFVLSLIPFGGYVKMLGESPEELVPDNLKSQTFYQKSVWARMIIVVAGPVFNLLLAMIALWGMFMIGITSFAPIVGTIEPGSIAQTAHLKKMDEITSINGIAVSNWQEVQMAIVSSIGEKTPILLKLYNIKTETSHFAEINLSSWTFDKKNNNLIAQLGITPAMPKIPPIIAKVYKNYPGAKAELQKGDRIIAVNGKKIHDWMEVVSIVQQGTGQKIQMKVRRHGELLDISMYPQIKESHGKRYGFIGVESKPPRNLKKIWLKTEHYSFFKAWHAAAHETWMLTALSFKLIGKLLTGTLSLHTISSPIGMAQGAMHAAQLGWAHYLSFIALVSVSLGVLNLLPIPVLDGGHLLYYVFEVILGRPLHEEIRLMGVRFGFLLLVGLMFLAVFNDLSRFYLS